MPFRAVLLSVNSYRQTWSWSLWCSSGPWSRTGKAAKTSGLLPRQNFFSICKSFLLSGSHLQGWDKMEHLSYEATGLLVSPIPTPINNGNFIKQWGKNYSSDYFTIISEVDCIVIKVALNGKVQKKRTKADEPRASWCGWQTSDVQPPDWLPSVWRENSKELLWKSFNLGQLLQCLAYRPPILPPLAGFTPPQPALLFSEEAECFEQTAELGLSLKLWCFNFLDPRYPLDHYARKDTSCLGPT